MSDVDSFSERGTPTLCECCICQADQAKGLPPNRLSHCMFCREMGKTIVPRPTDQKQTDQ